MALLRRNFADGRLTGAELEERAGAAYAAQTSAQLLDLTADQPADQQQPRPGMVLDQPPPAPSRPQALSATGLAGLTVTCRVSFEVGATHGTVRADVF